MLDLDLRPGDGLGPFVIGTSLWSILAMLRQPHFKTLFPSVHIKYDSTVSPKSVILVHLHPYLDLLFSGKAQRLHSISLRRLRHGLTNLPSPEIPGTTPSSVGSSRAGSSTLLLQYQKTVISSAEEILNRAGVSKSFGPTYDWTIMKYPGVAFLFEDESSTNIGRFRTSNTDDMKRVEVKKVLVTQKESDHDGTWADPFDEVLECPVMAGDLQSVIATISEGIELHFFSSPNSYRVELGITSAEDLRCTIGSPSSIYYKEDNRMAIHSTNEDIGIPQNSYFMNYFHHGMDFLIDGESHRVKKIILHSNILGSPLFQRYKRCPWSLRIPGTSESKTVDFSNSLETIIPRLSSSEPQFMELDRAEDDVWSLPTSYNKLYGFEGVILEATNSGYPSAVTLY